MRSTVAAPIAHTTRTTLRALASQTMQLKRANTSGSENSEDMALPSHRIFEVARHGSSSQSSRQGRSLATLALPADHPGRRGRSADRRHSCFRLVGKPVGGRWRPRCRLGTIRLVWPKKSSPSVGATTGGAEATSPLDDFPKLLIDLGREQIRGQEATSGAVTTKVLGLLGFDGVSTPLVIANRHVFGNLWWVLLLAAASIVVGAVIVLWGRPHDRGTSAKHMKGTRARSSTLPTSL